MYWLTGFKGTRLPLSQPNDDISPGRAINTIVRTPGGKSDAFGSAEAPLIPNRLTKSGQVRTLSDYNALRGLVGQRGYLVRAAILASGAKPTFGFFYPLGSADGARNGGYILDVYNNLLDALTVAGEKVGTPVTDLTGGSASGLVVGDINLNPNPNGSYYGGWSSVGGGTTYVDYQDGSGFHPTSQHFTLRAGDTNEVRAYKTITVNANTDYFVAADLKSIFTSSQAHLEVYGVNTGTVLAVSPEYIRTPQASDAIWERRELYFNTGSNTSIEIRLVWQGALGSKLYFNNVILKEGEGSSYFDGSTPNCSWTGTTGNSTSTVDTAPSYSKKLYSTTPEAFTLSAWVKYLGYDTSGTAGATGCVVALDSNNVKVELGDTGAFVTGDGTTHEALIGGVSQDSNVTVQKAVWVHLAVTIDGSNFSFYVDGTLALAGTFNRTSYLDDGLTLKIFNGTQLNVPARAEVASVFVTDTVLSPSFISVLATASRAELVSEYAIDARCVEVTSTSREDSLFYGIVNMAFETLGPWHEGSTQLLEYTTSASSESQTLTNDGNVDETDLEITITVAGAGDLTIATSSPAFSMTIYGLAANDKVEIDCRDRTLRINGVDAYVSAGISSSNETARWFPIPPGGTTITTSMSASRDVSYVWRNTFK